MAFVRQHPEYPKFRMKIGNIPGLSDLIMADPDDPNVYVKDQEVPNGIKNGINREFTLEDIPFKHTDQVFKDGMKMSRASSLDILDGDYFINYDNPFLNKSLTFSEKQVPQPQSVIHVNYKYKRV